MEPMKIFDCIKTGIFFSSWVINTMRLPSFALKIPSTDNILFLQAHAGNDYFVSRDALPKAQAKKAEILAIRKSWLSQEMVAAQIKQHESQGMVLGYVKGPSFHVTLDGERISDQDIYYFNEQNQIDSSRQDSVNGGGMFLLTNVKPGLHTLLMTSSDGELNNSRILVSEAGVLNVINGELNP
jgi:hypothetical protein